MGKIRESERNIGAVLTLLIFVVLGVISTLYILTIPWEIISAIADYFKKVSNVGGGYLVLLPVFFYFMKKVYRQNLAKFCFASENYIGDIGIGLCFSPVLTLLLFWENSLVPGGVYTPKGIYLILFMAMAGVIGPVMEEAFYRGVIYSLIRRKLGFFIGVFLSSAIFALSHKAFSVREVIPYFLTGIPLALLYEKRKSLFCPVVAHSAANLSTIFLGLVLYPRL